VVVKSAALVYGATARDPAWFTEDTLRSSPAATRVEQSLIEVEDFVTDFAADNPEIAVSMLRFSNVLGVDIVTSLSRSLEMALVPSIGGFDPAFQFVHEDDVVRSLLFAMDRRLRGTFNVAGAGKLPWSEMAAIAGKRLFPLVPFGTEPAARLLRLVGGPELPPETLDLLRHGRGLDTERLKGEGFVYNHDTAGTVASFVASDRLKRAVGAGGRQSYRYERDVEQFFRHSPAVVRDEPVG
jgi:UDP-glucose 4-epimerase